MSLSTLRPAVPSSSLHSLTDDSLLVILEYLSVPQLLAFLSISRRLWHLIKAYTLPKYKTILMPGWFITMHDFKAMIYFSRRFLAYSKLHKQRPTCNTIFTINRPLKYVFSGSQPSIALCSFPAFLPHLIPCLQSLSFSYFLESEDFLSSEQVAVNRILRSYVGSSWSVTLISLHLNLETSTCPSELIIQINQLHSLRHLFLNFTPTWCFKNEQWPQNISSLLPDSLPILGQLTRFMLHNYESSNTVTLLRQLGPNLAMLSLQRVNCVTQDFVAFLDSKPSYRQTLAWLAVSLQSRFYPNDNFQVCLVAPQFLPALKCLYSQIHVQGELYSFFYNLARLSQLQELHFLEFTIDQLRTLCDAHPRHTLPRLPSIRRLALNLTCYTLTTTDGQTFTESWDAHLSCLGTIFLGLEHIQIFLKVSTNRRKTIDLSIDRLTEKVKEHFPNVRQNNALVGLF